MIELVCIALTIFSAGLALALFIKHREEKMLIDDFLKMDAISLKYVKILSKQLRLEPEEYDPAEIAVLYHMQAGEWLNIHTDGAITRGSRMSYICHRIGTDELGM
ncbi:hypothetical protein [Pseudoalteromonas sp. Of11M-6]|uniref:hypothetical protein n=1 Tax=Pseudoalteromonas sp. Of11M-6 TaxID=2917754 RepID=UPI001EF73D9B|nr:hypothetical protein [Pseudoalteromonas sp. Of11M-6]MCG7556069.1 hypothetical protein [Pseudoalteromonas sp. Of11M-6]